MRLYRIHFVSKENDVITHPTGWEVIAEDNEALARNKFWKLHKWNPHLTIVYSEEV